MGCEEGREWNRGTGLKNADWLLRRYMTPFRHRTDVDATSVYDVMRRDVPAWYLLILANKSVQPTKFSN